MNSGSDRSASSTADIAGPDAPRFVVAFPDWPPAIRARIAAVRAAHDPQADLIAPHLTLVFGVRGITEAAWAHHLRRAVAGVTPFDIRLGALRLHREGPRGWVCWSVDDGTPALHRLHAALHTGPLAGAHDPARPFDPHVTLASGPDLAALQALIDREAPSWPASRVALDALWIGALGQGRFVRENRVALGSAA